MENKEYKILFVCLGNICRSPIGECVMQKKAEKNGLTNIKVDSAGLISYHTGEQPDSRMISAGAKKGYFLNHRARKISEQDFYDFDLIIGMDKENVIKLKNICPSPNLRNKIRPASDYFTYENGFDCVPDPYYGSQKDFYKVIELVEDVCDGIIKELI
ncbi:MAG: low molecular weight phosphotyrosine protein phosphatase [Bacteroidales bacterium]|nr:low molecular weight phosphotyrosine protein phosphatase [Bacteroidales bacterium]